MALDADFQAEFDATTDPDVRASILAKQDARRARESVSALSNALTPLAGPRPYQQDLYLQVLDLCLRTRMAYVAPGSAVGTHVLDQVVAQALSMAVKAYPVVKAHVDLIAQGSNPQ